MRRRSRAAVLFSLAGLLGLSACIAADDPTTTSIPRLSTSTTASSSTTTPPTTVPVATLPPGSVGDPAVIEAARTEALRLIEIDPASFPPGAGEMEIPWPDTTNPDPVEALRSIWEFDEWVATTLPYDAFARMYLVEDSPAWRSAGEFIEQLWINGWIVVFDDPEGYVFEGGDVIQPSDSAVPAETLVGAPAGSVVVRYSSSISSFRTEYPDGEVVTEFSGSQGVERDALVSPTPLGWRLLWFGAVSS